MRINGATLRYCIEGSGTPALAIGSAIYYPRTFSPQLKKALRLACIDVRHFAEPDHSPRSDPVSLHTYIEDIEHIRAHLGLQRVVLLGHSHHGNLALEYAKRYPSRVSHLVLIGTPPTAVRPTVEAAEKYWEEHADERRKSVLRRNLAALESEAYARLAPEDAYVAQYVAEGPKYWFDPTFDASCLWRGVPVNMALIRVFRDFFAGDYEFAWDPELLRAPVLVVMGRHDYAVPHVLWDEPRMKLRNLTYHLFDNSGHTPQLEEPERFCRVLLEWLEACSD